MHVVTTFTVVYIVDLIFIKEENKIHACVRTFTIKKKKKKSRKKKKYNNRDVTREYLLILVPL